MKLMTVLIGLVLVTNLFSQGKWYNNLEWEVVKLGYANTSDLQYANKSGTSVGSELRYNLSRNVSMGIANDFSLFFSNIEGEDFDFDYLARLSITTDYYISTSVNTKTFFGLAIGNLSTNTIFIRDGDELNRLEERNGFVFGPRFGLEHKSWRVTLHKSISADKNIPNDLTLSIGWVLWNDNKVHKVNLKQSDL